MASPRRGGRLHQSAAILRNTIPGTCDNENGCASAPQACKRIARKAEWCEDMAVLALDLGGTKLAGAILAENGRKLIQAHHPLEGRGGKAVGELVRRQVALLIAGARSRGLQVDALGLSVPGISHARTGTVWAPNIPGWEAYPLRRELQACLGRNPVPIKIDNDRACSLLGETWKGRAKGCRHAIFLAVGTGIGAGIMVDGQVLRGAHDIAGVDWMAGPRPPFPSRIRRVRLF